jgi:hypothetical protein
MSFTPQYETIVDQSVFVEPIKSSPDADILIDKYFPESNFDTSKDSVLHKFLRSILGPAGVGLIRKDLFHARRILEEHGFQNNQLEKFYADPLRFSRNITSTPFSESYSEDPLGILTVEQWQDIQAKDRNYRNRAMDFLHAARLGGTPDGVRMAAKSAAGYEFDLVENYKYMFDQHSDEVIGLENLRGNKTVKINDSSEFILIPNQEVSRTLIKHIKFEDADLIVKGFIKLSFGSKAITITYRQTDSEFYPKGITALDLQNALSWLSSVGKGNVTVKGNIIDGFEIKLFNNYSDQFSKSFAITSLLKYKLSSADRDQTAISYPDSKITISETWARESFNEIVSINQYDANLISSAVDKIKPFDSYGTYYSGQSVYQNHPINTVSASSSYYEVTRHITGNNSIAWPEPVNGHWIESGIEKQAPKVQNQLKQHYQGFHQPLDVVAYSNDDPTNNSFKQGNFDPNFKEVFRDVSYVYKQNNNSEYLPTWALADFPEVINIDSKSEKYNLSYFNSVYPATSQITSIVSNIGKYTSSEQFWASNESTNGSESLEIDLGAVKAVNFISFETFKVPVDIEIFYDVAGIKKQKTFVPVVPEFDLYYNKSLNFDYNQTSLPWKYLSYNFTDRYEKMIFARYIKIRFTRKTDDANIFLPKRGTFKEQLSPWPVFVKNLRIGRNV